MLALIWRFILFISAIWFVRRILGFLFGPVTRQPGPAAQAGDSDNKKMVRDPVCGMYLDPRLAISLKDRKDTHYFCSQECRQKFTTGTV